MIFTLVFEGTYSVLCVYNVWDVHDVQEVDNVHENVLRCQIILSSNPN